MNIEQLMNNVKEFWAKQSPFYTWTDYILQASIETLSDTERELLGKNPATLTSEETDQYKFLMYRVFHRHSDICLDNTKLIINEDGTKRVSITDNSFITELDISYDTLISCLHAMFFRISNMHKAALPNMELEPMAEAFEKYWLCRDKILDPSQDQ